MASTKDKLTALESSDRIVQAVAANVRSIFEDLGIGKQLPDLQIFFPEFGDNVTADPVPEYFTLGCLSLKPSTVVVNARFLRDTEAAIRSFGIYENFLSTPYLRNDACMFGLVKRIRNDGDAWLEKLRSLEDGFDEEARSSTMEELTLTALFFCAHEVGHLLDGVDARQYTTFLDPTKPLETRLAHASTRLVRHASEFEALGFDLPGWQGAVQPEHEVFKAAEKLREETLTQDEKDDDELNIGWFQNEVSADDFAAKMMIRYLKDQPKRSRWLLVRGLFAAAIYAWYADFLAFCEIGNVPRMGTKPMLSFELMKNPEAYISAASLFGDLHRFTLLRSALGIQAILNADRGFDDGGRKSSVLNRAIAFWDKLFAVDEPDQQYWKSQSAQRHLLLAIHMDTAVKLAYVGASSPWIAEVDAKREAPQIRMVQFEAIDQSVGRLMKVMGMN